MTTTLFFQISALIVLSAIVYGYMTHVIMTAFLEKCAQMPQLITPETVAENDQPAFDPQNGFGTSPVGFPPSLGRE